MDSVDSAQALHTGAENVLTDIQEMASHQPQKFKSILSQVFGSKLSNDAQAELAQQAQNRRFPMPANIQFASDEQLKGGKGAYSPANGGTVYLNESLAHDPAALEQTLLEEVGHHLDHKLGGLDTRGDEGEMFQTALHQGRPLSKGQFAKLQRQRDIGTININGQDTMVEFKQTQPVQSKARYQGILDSIHRVMGNPSTKSEAYQAAKQQLALGQKVLDGVSGKNLNPAQVKAIEHFRSKANSILNEEYKGQLESYATESKIYSGLLAGARATKHVSMGVVDNLASVTPGGNFVKGAMHGLASFGEAWMSGKDPRIAGLMATITGIIHSIPAPKGLSKGEKLGEALVLSVHQTLAELGKHVNKPGAITPELVARTFATQFGKRASGTFLPNNATKLISKAVIGLISDYYGK